MGFVAAGLAVAAVGAGVSAYGAAQNAKAVGAANASNAANEELFAEEQGKALNKLINKKENKLSNLGNIFSRMESTGAFGDTDTLKNLRKAQNDFSMLAAGDFSGFESQLRKTLSDSLIGVAGSGAPIGTYAGLAADAQLNYRLQGLQTSMGVTEFLSNESYKLLGQEFGIMDQKFQTNYNTERAKISNIANYRLGKAATEGVGTAAYGGAISQVGASLTSYGTYQGNMGIQQQALDNSRAALAQPSAPRPNNINAGFTPYPAVNASPSFQSYAPASMPSFNFPSGTIYPSDPGYSSFGGGYSAPSNPFSYGSGYNPAARYQASAPSEPEMILPPMASNGYSSALARVGYQVVQG